MTALPLLASAAPVKPYAESHPIGYVWLVLVIVAAAIELAGLARRRPEATRRDRGSLIVTRVSVIVAVLLAILARRIVPAADMHPALAFTIAGMVIFAAGEALRVWAKITLGRYFTYTVQTSSEQPVISAGPYRVVRHPSYTGILLIVIGVGTVWGNWLGLGVLTLGALAGLLYRISVEERALLADLGDRYRAYAEDRKRLIPFVW